MSDAQVSRWRSVCSNDGDGPTPEPRSRLALGGAWLLVMGLVAMGLAGCALFRGAVNQSPELRWWLFSTFGASHLCPEMLVRSAPLRLLPGGNVIGRLFPTGCQHRVDEQRRTISLEFTGTGYAWTPLAGRVGF